MICGVDDSTAGGAANSKWATSTDLTAIYPTNAKAIVVGGTATSTQDVVGQFYGPIEFTKFTATSTATSSSLFGGIQALRALVGTIEATSTTSSIFTANPTFSGLTSALILTGAGGLTAEYTGVTCTNQFLRVLDTLGAGTCATVGTADVSGLDISDDTNLAATWPVVLTGDTLSFTGLSTTTELTAGQSVYATGKNTIGSVATTTLSASAPFNGLAGLGFLVGGSNSTLTWSGLATTSEITAPNLLYASTKGGVASVATGTVSASGGVTVTAGRSAVGGALAITCTASDTNNTGCLSDTDWDTFNNKGSGTVTSIVAGLGLTGGTITTSGTINSAWAVSGNTIASTSVLSVGIATSSSNYLGTLTVASSTGSQLFLSDTTNASGGWWMRAISGNFFMGTTTGAIATSTPAAFQINGTGFPSLLLGTSTGHSAASTTIVMQRLQFQGTNSAGTLVCAYLNPANAWVIEANVCK